MKVLNKWKMIRLKEVISLCHNGIWGNDPQPNEKSYPVIRSTEITHDGKINLSNVTFRKIPEEKIKKYSLQNGDILLVASSGSSHLIGRVALFKQPSDSKIYLFSNFMIRIRPKNINPKFLYYSLNSPRYYHFLKQLQQTSTGLRNLPKKEFLEFKLPLPPLPEQQKIAEILSTVDSAIEKVNQAIEKTQRLKKGLMQELLTKGIGHKEFKDTEIGRIPKEWEVVRLGKIAKFKNGINFSKEQKGNKGILTIDVLNMYGENVYLNLNNLYRVDVCLNDNSEYLLKKGDILFVRSSLKREGAGWVSLFDGWIEPITFCGFIIRARLNDTNILPEFLVYFLRSDISRSRLIAGSGQVAVTNITQEIIKLMRVPIPPLPEQQKIAEILSTVDKRLELLRAKKEKLERIKKGLMNDLLTGKRRVKV